MKSKLDKAAHEVCRGALPTEPQACPENDFNCPLGHACRPGCTLCKPRDYDLTQAQIEQVEANIERMRRGNLAYDNDREQIK